MTAINAGASSACLTWENIDFDAMEQQANRQQMRIAKAVKEGRYGKAKALQWLLTHSFAAKCMAVKRVTTNKGKKTPGIDGVCWVSSAQKVLALLGLKRKGYKAQPLRRLHIPKKNGKTRPLGIPTMKDRAMQALYALALSPVAETLADNNSYGFRPKRSAIDAIEQCFNSLSQKTATQWVLEADIKACFDNISHDWLMEHIMIDKMMLAQWLKCGYVENELFHVTQAGTPQGGIISPIFANLTLDGLEATVKAAIKGRRNMNIVRYADDFIVTAQSPEILADRVKPVVNAFLAERGLTLSEEKTHITHINSGFDFLGFNVRKYNGKLLIKPAKANVKSLLAKIQGIIKSQATISADKLICQLNPVIRGWANYFRHVVSKKCFSYIDHRVNQMLCKWIRRRHNMKNAIWRKRKYFTKVDMNNWRFFAFYRDSVGLIQKRLLYLAASTPIKRHIKIRGAANPFLKEYEAYFESRNKRVKPVWKLWHLLPVQYSRWT